MARIIQVVDVDAAGHTLRLDTGELVKVPHGHGDALGVGDEFGGEPVPVIPPTIEQLNSPEQVVANVLSQVATDNPPEE